VELAEVGSDALFAALENITVKMHIFLHILYLAGHRSSVMHVGLGVLFLRSIDEETD